MGGGAGDAVSRLGFVLGLGLSVGGGVWGWGSVVGRGMGGENM